VGAKGGRGGGGVVMDGVQNWYNPDNVTITSGYVTAWPDQMNNYNLSNLVVGASTVNTMTRVVASGTTSNVIYQTGGTTNYSYLTGGTFSETIYSVVFCCNTTAVNSGFDGIFANNFGGAIPLIRYLVGTVSLNYGDLNQNGSTYVNGTSVQSVNTVTFPASVPTGYTTYCFYITGTMRTGITQLVLLGDPSYHDRTFNGYAGDFFVGNASFGTTHQQKIEGYLGYKYKCQSKLPTNHPYYSATNSIVVTIP